MTEFKTFSISLDLKSYHQISCTHRILNLSSRRKWPSLQNDTIQPKHYHADSITWGILYDNCRFFSFSAHHWLSDFSGSSPAASLRCSPRFGRCDTMIIVFVIGTVQRCHKFGTVPDLTLTVCVIRVCSGNWTDAGEGKHHTRFVISRNEGVVGEGRHLCVQSGEGFSSWYKLVALFTSAWFIFVDDWDDMKLLGFWVKWEWEPMSTVFPSVLRCWCQEGYQDICICYRVIKCSFPDVKEP